MLDEAGSNGQVKGGEVRYLHLAHNKWDAAARRSVPRPVYSFGREDQLDKDADSSGASGDGPLSAITLPSQRIRHRSKNGISADSICTRRLILLSPSLRSAK